MGRGVGRHVVSELPGAGSEQIVWMADQREICQILEGLPPPALIELARTRVPSQHLRHFQSSRWGACNVSPTANSRPATRTPAGVFKSTSRTGVGDDHRRSR